MRTITDKERLDWLDQNGRIARFSDGWNAWTVGKRDSFIRDTVRQAIDTAMAEVNRIRENLEFIAANPTANYPKGWVEEVQAEARAAHLLPPLPVQIGCNCNPGIDAQITYSGDFADTP